MSLQKIIKTMEKNFSSLLNDYSDVIATKFNLDIEELKKVNETFLFDNLNKEKEVTKTMAKKKKEEIDESTLKRCIYTFCKGEKTGEVCNAIIKDKDNVDSVLCKKHLKSNVSCEKKKLKELIHETKKTEATTPGLKQTKINYTLSMNKLINKFWHVDTQFVFHSKENLVVIGTYRNDKLNEFLTEEDIELCKKYRFRYEEKKVPVPEPPKKEKKLIADEAKNIEDVIDGMFKKDGEEDEDSDVETNTLEEEPEPEPEEEEEDEKQEEESDEEEVEDDLLDEEE